jgi:hypothetical protein
VRSLLGHKRTSRYFRIMSALHLKRHSTVRVSAMRHPVTFLVNQLFPRPRITECAFDRPFDAHRNVATVMLMPIC